MTLCLWAMFIWGSLAALVVGLGKSLCLRRCEVGMQLLSRYVMPVHPLGKPSRPSLTGSSREHCYSACYTASQSVRDTGIVTVSPLLLRSFQRTRFGQRPAGSETADSHFPASRNKRSASVNDVCFSLCLCCFCLQFCTPHS